MLSRADDENEAWLVNGEHIQRSKLRLDARKWMASKLQPKKYGDKVALTGGSGGPIETVTRIELVTPGDGDNETSQRRDH
nr:MULTISPECIES: hypothetical protein [unclassified Bosea (in: a-proteobacteria)]